MDPRRFLPSHPRLFLERVQLRGKATIDAAASSSQCNASAIRSTCCRLHHRALDQLWWEAEATVNGEHDPLTNHRPLLQVTLQKYGLTGDTNQTFKATLRRFSQHCRQVGRGGNGVFTAMTGSLPCCSLVRLL